MSEAESSTAPDGGAVRQGTTEGGPRRRRRVPGARPHQVNAVFTTEEFAVAAARAAGQRMTVPHYLAHVTLVGSSTDSRSLSSALAASTSITSRSSTTPEHLRGTALGFRNLTNHVPTR